MIGTLIKTCVLRERRITLTDAHGVTILSNGTNAASLVLVELSTCEATRAPPTVRLDATHTMLALGICLTS